MYYARSTGAGASFSEPVRVPKTANPVFSVNGSSQDLLMRRSAVNQAGNITVVDSAFEQGGGRRVRWWLDICDDCRGVAGLIGGPLGVDLSASGRMAIAVMCWWRCGREGVNAICSALDG